MRTAMALAVLLFGVAPANATQLPNRIAMISTGGAGGAGATVLPMVDSRIEVELHGPIATAVVTQTFKNESDRVTEATYIFPLPADASVSAMSITTGTRTIHAAIEKRAEATKRYEAAVASGVRAATLEQERPDVFTQTVSAIPARGTVVITIRFDTIARYRATTGLWELAIPLVVAPRFVPGTASGRPTTGVGRAPDTDRAPDASRVTPNGAPGAGGRTEIALAFGDGIDNVSSPTHALVGAGRSWTLVDPKSDHDAIVRWHATAPAAGWVEQGPDGSFAAIVVEGGPLVARKPGAPVRTTLVVDRAATTRGDADAVMHPLVRALFATLDPADHVALGGSDQVGGMMAPRDAAAAIERAWSRAAGAFDLTRVLGAIKPEGGAVVLVTDGLVADDAAAIAAAVKLGVPVHVVGVGPAPNRSLLGAIASATSGTARIASTADDLGSLAREVIADVASPPSPVAMTWGTLAASELVPATRPRIGAGQAMLVLARIKTAGPANGRARDGVFGMAMLPAPRAVAGATSPRGVLARRWARDRLDELLAKRDATATTAHALAYGLVSPYTTMVAIGDEVVVDGGVKHSVAVPVSVPAGMRWQEVQKQVRVETETVATKNVDQVTKVADKPADEKPAPKPEPKPTKPVPVPKIVAKPDVTRPVRKPIASGPAAPSVAQPQADQPHETRDVGAAEDDGEFDDARKKRPSLDLDRGVEPAPMSPTSTGAARMSDGDDVSEEVSIASYEGSARLRKRLAVSLGGGLVHHLDTAGLVALGARYEVGRATMVGVDTSLWLVDGLHVQGRALLSFARRGLFGMLELGGGVGLHLGDGAGPAWSLSLRLRPHAHGIGGFLRYDGAYVLDHGSGRGQAAATGGVEYTF